MVAGQPFYFDKSGWFWILEKVLARLVDLFATKIVVVGFGE
jgi:hypothetical protein